MAKGAAALNIELQLALKATKYREASINGKAFIIVEVDGFPLIEISREWFTKERGYKDFRDIPRIAEQLISTWTGEEFQTSNESSNK